MKLVHSGQGCGFGCGEESEMWKSSLVAEWVVWKELVRDKDGRMERNFIIHDDDDDDEADADFVSGGRVW